MVLLHLVNEALTTESNHYNYHTYCGGNHTNKIQIELKLRFKIRLICSVCKQLQTINDTQLNLGPLIRYANNFKQLADIKAEAKAQFGLEIHSLENRNTPNAMYVIHRPCQIKMTSLIVEHN